MITRFMCTKAQILTTVFISTAQIQCCWIWYCNLVEKHVRSI